MGSNYVHVHVKRLLIRWDSALRPNNCSLINSFLIITLWGGYYFHYTGKQIEAGPHKLSCSGTICYSEDHAWLVLSLWGCLEWQDPSQHLSAAGGTVKRLLGTLPKNRMGTLCDLDKEKYKWSQKLEVEVTLEIKYLWSTLYPQNGFQSFAIQTHNITVHI